MTVRLIVIGLWVLTGLLLVGPYLAPVVVATEASEPATVLEQTVDKLISARKPLLDGRRISMVTEIDRFYRQRHYALAWTDRSGSTAQATALLAAIEAGIDDGLNPSDYHFAAIKKMQTTLEHALGQQRTPDPEQTVVFDLLASDAFFGYGSHLLNGRIDPRRLEPDWQGQFRRVDWPKLLQIAVNEGSVAQSLEGLRSSDTVYQALRGLLRRYRQIRDGGSWEPIDAGDVLTIHDWGPRVVALKKHLRLYGDLEAPAGEADLPLYEPIFDETLVQALRRYQLRHNLVPSGRLDRLTTASLSIPPEQRVQQIEANLERRRWLPADPGSRYLAVNLADYSLKAFDAGQTLLEMRIIIGRPDHRTPIFSNRITRLILNPFWYIPPEIAAREIVPVVRRQPEYLERSGIRLFAAGSADRVAIDPDTIDWEKAQTAGFPFYFRQDPGPENPLGSIKFIIPNQLRIYLHDTPKRGLFARTDREFSFGCIRVEKPVHLAAFLLQDSKRWTVTEIRRAIDNGHQRDLSVPRPVPIHIQYWTVWVDRRGRAQFRPDIYQIDQRLNDMMTHPR
jgi:L,D-transpeptidase YcbB